MAIMLQIPVYLDHNATTPCDPRVVECMLPYFTVHFGNAASRHHAFGQMAAASVELAREQLARLIGSEEGEIIFTSGATESANLALKGVVEAYASKGNHIITTAVEHKAVLDTCKILQKKGTEITFLPVNDSGQIDLTELEDSIRPETILISVLFANNEIGTIMPVREIALVAKKHGVLFFTDATQAVGKVPVDVSGMGIDLMALSAHKFYGPKGIGALYVRRRNPRVRLTAQVHGGGHEKGLRSGTLNVPAIVGMGKAAEICLQEMNEESTRVAILRDKLEAGIMAAGDVWVNGDRTSRIPNLTNLCFGDVDGQALLLSLNKDLAVSSGSACTSASLEPSYVLKAIGRTDELAYSSLRFGVGRFTTDKEIDFAIDKVTTAVRSLKGTFLVEDSK